MNKETRLGWWPGAYAATLLGYLILCSVAWSTPRPVAHPNVGVIEAVQPSLASPAPSAFIVLLLLLQGALILSALFAHRSTQRAQRGVRGRLRVRIASLFGIFHVTSAWAGIAIVISLGDSLGTLPSDTDAFTRVLHAATDVIALPTHFHHDSASVARIAVTVTAVLALLSMPGFWFLIPVRIRRGLWLVQDSILLVAFVYASLSLPLFPAEEGPRELTGPSLRLGITCLFIARALLRLLPLLLNVFEKTSYQLLVATRHLRAKKSGFLATISALSIMAVAFSSCSLTTTLSVMGGFRQDLKNKILGNNAHVVVDHPDGVFEGWVPMLEEVSGAEGVQAATPVLTGEVMISSASNLAGALLRGIDTESIGAVTDLEGNMRWGELSYLDSPVRLLDLPDGDAAASPEEGEDEEAGESDNTDVRSNSLTNPLRTLRTVRPGIVLGQELARNLRVYVGDEVDVVSPFGDLGPTGPMPKTRAFRVAGIFYSGMYEYDIKHAYVLLETAQRFLNTGNAISRIEIKASDVETAPAVSASVAERIPDQDFRTRDWQELNRGLFGALALEKLAMFVALGIAILVAGFCVFGTLTLMVQEKHREVGVLKSMGASRREIVRIFMLEGAMIGVFGSLIGLGLGFVVGFTAENFGIRMDPQVYYIDRLPVQMDAMEFLWVGLTSAVVSLLATIVPAVLASRMQPVEALRHD